MRNIKLVGHIKTVAPVVVSLPSVAGIPKNAQGQYYIPATSVRGMLRGAATVSVCAILNTVGKRLSTDDIYMNYSGVDTGRKIKLGGGYETIGKNIAIREANPIISLFGNFALTGHLKVGNAFCDANTSPISVYGNGSRNHPFNRNPNLFDFVSNNEMEYLKGVMEADALTSLETSDLKNEKVQLKSQLKQADSDEKKIIYAQLDEIDAKIKATKQARTGSSESILRTLDGFEAIDPDHNLQHRFTLTNPSQNDLNFFLWTLYKASAYFNIGGHQNLGCGEVHAFWEIKETSLENPIPKIIGTITIDDDGFKLEGMEDANFNPKLIEAAIIDGAFDFSKY